MLRAVNALKQRAGGRGRLFVAHLNHGLRGADAAADQTWLTVLCGRLGVPFHAGARRRGGLGGRARRRLGSCCPRDAVTTFSTAVPSKSGPAGLSQATIVTIRLKRFCTD